MLDSNDIEQIKGLLQPIYNAIEAHSKTLETHSKTLDDHGKTLVAQSKTLEDHSKTFEDHGKMLAAQSKTLEDHGKTLEDHGTKITDINLTLENKIIPMLNLLAEGQQSIIDRLIPVSRVEKLEEDVTILKIAERKLNDDLRELKKAQ